MTCDKNRFFFVLVFLCLNAEAAKRVGTKKFAIKQVCDGVEFNGYKILSCKFSVDITGFPAYPYTKADFFNEVGKYYFPATAKGTCFKANSITVNGDTTDHSEKDKTLTRNEKDGYPDNIQCKQVMLSLTKAFHTTTDCRFLPMNAPANCQSYTMTRDTILIKDFEYDDVTKQVTLLGNKLEGSDSTTSSQKCDLIPNMKDYLMLGYYTAQKCQDILKRAEKCKDKEYNENVWKSCTYSAFKSIDATFMTPGLEQLNSKYTDYCANQLPNLKTCVDKEGFCEKPDKTSFYEHKQLYSYFTTVCSQSAATKKQQECLSKIGANQLKFAREEFANCFDEAFKNSNNDCSSVQFSVLCRPLLLLKYAKGCSSFDELYQAEIDTRDWTECSASKTKLDPCTTQLTARHIKCNGSPALLSSSTLLVMVASILFCVFY